jgi:hypothetical protein
MGSPGNWLANASTEGDLNGVDRAIAKRGLRYGLTDSSLLPALATAPRCFGDLTPNTGRW